MGYRICSFNVRRSIRDDSKDRDFYDFINNLISKEHIDIFAFQEAKSKHFIDDLKRNLSGLREWRGEYIQASELAFIWNAQRVCECSKQGEPRLYIDYPAEQHIMREPAYGRFAPVWVGPYTEYRLLNLHLYHGQNDAQSVDTRKAECALAKGVIHQRIDAHRYGNGRRSFTVVLGDYNLGCQLCNTCGPANVQTIQEEPTTLKASEPWGYNQSYDHFSYDVIKNDSVSCEAMRVDAVKEYFDGNYELYRTTISDHVPIIFEIDSDRGIILDGYNGADKSAAAG